MATRMADRARSVTRSVARRIPSVRRLMDRPAVLEAEIDALHRRVVALSAAATAERHDPAPASGHHIRVEYAVRPRQRDHRGTAGGDALHALVRASDDRYRAVLEAAADAAAQMSSVPVDAPSDARLPHWNNGWFPPLDGLLLTHFLRERRPATYLEIGSGNSTKFARRAIDESGLSTRIVSIDPMPRAEIDDICDHVVRAGLESAEVLDSFRALQPGDIVFFDGSHYCFQNSDVTVFFLEVLQEIPPGCLYGIHDIYLPDDYPVEWLDRHYNEQYMLAAWLLGGAGGDEIVLPATYVSSRPQFSAGLDRLIELSGAGPERHGGAFWMQRA